MSHKIIFLLLFSIALIISFSKLIKNKPEYLVLLGIRGLFSLFFIHFINYLCAAQNFVTVIAANPFSLITGAFLGLPGLILLYALGIYIAV